MSDLISREALRKAFHERIWYFTKSSWDEANALIDSAPTVEPKLKDDIIEAFNLITDQEFEHSDSFWIETPKGKKIEFEKKRPQGEWNYIQARMCVCPFCGARPHKDFKNFCANCGAKMGKGDVE